MKMTEEKIIQGLQKIIQNVNLSIEESEGIMREI